MSNNLKITLSHKRCVGTGSGVKDVTVNDESIVDERIAKLLNLDLEKAIAIATEAFKEFK